MSPIPAEAPKSEPRLFDQNIQEQNPIDIIDSQDSKPIESTDQPIPVISEIANKESINNSKSENKESLSKRKKKIIAALAAIVIAATAFSAGTLFNKNKDNHTTPNNSDDNPIERNNPSSEASNSAIITDTEVTIGSAESTNTAETTQDPGTIEWFKLDWSKQSQELQDLNNMSVEEFRSQPLEKQLLYYSFLNHIYFINYGENEATKEGMIYSDSEAASLDDTAESIVNQEKTKLLLMDFAMDENRNFDKDEARKLQSSTTEDINSAINPNDNKETGQELYDKAFMSVPNGQKYSKIVDRYNLEETGSSKSEVKYRDDGTPFVTITVTKKDGTSYNLDMVFVTYKNFEGKDQSVWVNSELN